jgi:hypothetical protein
MAALRPRFMARQDPQARRNSAAQAVLEGFPARSACLQGEVATAGNRRNYGENPLTTKNKAVTIRTRV